MPYPPFIDDTYLVALQAWMPFVLLVSYIYPAINIVKSVVYEKEKKLKVWSRIVLIHIYNLFVSVSLFCFACVRVKCDVVEWVKINTCRWFGHLERKKNEEFVKKVM